MKTEQNSVKNNFIYNTIYQLFLIIMPLLTAPYISRVMGSEGLGTYSFVYSIANYFVLFAMLGISNYGTRIVAINRDNKTKLSRAFSEVYFLQFLNTSIIGIIYFTYVYVFIEFDPLIYYIQGILVISTLLDINWLYFGLEEFKLVTIRNIVIKCLTFISIFIFVHSREDLWKYSLIMSLGVLISQLILWHYIKGKIKLCKPNFSEIKKHIKPIFILFIPVIAYSVYKIMDKIMLGSMSTMNEVGVYDAALNILNIPMGIVIALGTVMMPRISNLVSKNEKATEYRYLEISFLTITAIASSISFGLASISLDLMPLYLGMEFEKSGELLIILAPTTLFIAWSSIIRNQYLIPHKCDNIYIISTVAGAVLNFCLNLLLIPIMQSYGAAIGTLVAEATVLLIQLFLTRKIVNFTKMIFKNFIFLLFGLIMFAILTLFINVYSGTILGVAFQIIVGATIYIVLFLLYWKLLNPLKKWGVK
nr:flippase [Lysinibacillus timonensis]